MSLPAFAADRPLYALALFVWGGVIGGLYTVGLAALAEKFHGPKLGDANAAYIMMYALGMMAGPPALGLGLDLASPHGLFDALALFFAAYLLLVVIVNGPFSKRRAATRARRAS